MTIINNIEIIKYITFEEIENTMRELNIYVRCQVESTTL